MKIQGKHRPFDFEQLLRKICMSDHRNQLLKISQEGFLSDGVLLSRLTSKESQALNRMHMDQLVTDKKYSKTQPVQMESILPKYLGPRVQSVQELGKEGQGTRVALIEGGGLKLFVSWRAVCTLKDRHPEASWRFAWGPSFFRKPICLIETEGFEKGTLLGCLGPLRTKETPDWTEETPRTHKRVMRPQGWTYKKLG